MGVDIYYFYHGFGLKAFEGRHIRMIDDSQKAIDYKLFKTSFQIIEIILGSHMYILFLPRVGLYVSFLPLSDARGKTSCH
jgi:hypothetical protein